jgi:O-antigen ligase
VASFINGLKLRQVMGVIGAMFALGAALYVYSQFSNDLLATTVRLVISSPNTVEALVERGGNRIPRMLAAIYIFGNHPLVGVGIGQYRNTSNVVDLSAFAKGNSELSAQNDEAINIYVELLATTGIPTATLFFLFLIRSVTIRKARELDDRQKSILIGLVSMLLMLNFESNYLRPYLWMLLGAYAGIVRAPSGRTQLVRAIYPRPILSGAARSAATSGGPVT